MCITIFLWVLFAIQIGSQLLGNALVNISSETARIARILPLVGMVAAAAQAGFRTHQLARSRDKLVVKHGIPYEGPVYTCLTSFFCFPCASTQLLRQMGYGKDGTPYPGPCTKEGFEYETEIQPAV